MFSFINSVFSWIHTRFHLMFLHLFFHEIYYRFILAFDDTPWWYSSFSFNIILLELLSFFLYLIINNFGRRRIKEEMKEVYGWNDREESLEKYRLEVRKGGTRNKKETRERLWRKKRHLIIFLCFNCRCKSNSSFFSPLLSTATFCLWKHVYQNNYCFQYHSSCNFDSHDSEVQRKRRKKKDVVEV